MRRGAQGLSIGDRFTTRRRATVEEEAVDLLTLANAARAGAARPA
jgi:hypothetical protein